MTTFALNYYITFVCACSQNFLMNLVGSDSFQKISSLIHSKANLGKIANKGSKPITPVHSQVNECDLALSNERLI